MSKIKVLPERYTWTCSVQWCGSGRTADTRAEVEAYAERHEAMHKMAKGRKVRVVSSSVGLRHWAHKDDIGTITYAYIDQDRFGIKLDRKGDCYSSDDNHCESCNGKVTLTDELGFDQLELVRG